MRRSAGKYVGHCTASPGRQGPCRHRRHSHHVRPEPYRDRVPARDAAVVKLLHDAGAVLVAKLSLGALALNDICLAARP